VEKVKSTFDILKETKKYLGFKRVKMDLSSLGEAVDFVVAELKRKEAADRKAAKRAS
jgi:hypothetical protein